MKKALLSLAVLLLCLACISPILAAAKFDASPNSNYRQDLFTFIKHQNRSFLKQVWQTVVLKRHLRQKFSPKEAKLNFGGGALIAVSLVAITIFIYVFWELAIIAWAACMVLGVIGLFKDERKAMAIIALSLALVLPVIVLILFSLTCCEP
ncbi:MAG: hypothetical protein HY842_20065 [Bacteroidetes bacterium]|nr:hypothetical protein [Bacteroidota bacterium]